MASYNITKIQQEVDSYNFDGNIVPHSWYSHIKMPSGNCDLLGCSLLAEVLYWYRLSNVYDDLRTTVIGRRKKFSGDAYYQSNQCFADKFGVTKRMVADALKRLEDQGLIYREFRTVQQQGNKIPNVQFIVPLIDNIKMLDISRNNVIGSEGAGNTGKRDTYNEITLYGSPDNVIGVTSKRDTYTENTTQITQRAASSKEGFPEEKQCNANDTNVLAAADFLIGCNLTVTQCDYIRDKLAEFAKDSATATEGWHCDLDEQDIFAVISQSLTDPNQFKRCANKFEYKLNSILNEIARGNFGRIIADVKALQSAKDLRHGQMDSKPTPAQELQASIKRLQNERQCQMQALTGPMAQYPDFVSATQACISKLDQDITDIQCELDILSGASRAQIMAAPDFTADHSAQGGS